MGRNIVQLGSNFTSNVANDNLGAYVTISADGNTIAFSTPLVDYGGYSNRGMVQVYTMNLMTKTWEQKGGNIYGAAFANEEFGQTIAISGNGLRLIVGVPNADYNTQDTGLVRVYQWDTGVNEWVKMGTDLINDSNNFAQVYTGSTVAISYDGSVIAFGIRGHSEAGATQIGSVRSYEWIGNTWVRRGMDIDGNNWNDIVGYTMSMSDDGRTVAVGYPNGFVPGTSNRNGFVAVYWWTGFGWVKKGAYIWGTVVNSQSGYSVAISGDASTLVIGQPYYNFNVLDYGTVRVYRWDESDAAVAAAIASGEDSMVVYGTWTQIGQVLQGVTSVRKGYGYQTAISTHGTHISVVGYTDRIIYSYYWNSTAAQWVQSGDPRPGWSVAYSK